MPFFIERLFFEMIMKTNILILMVLLSACTALNNPQNAIQPVVYKNLKEKIFFTSCSGAVEEWNDCKVKANRTCEKGYTIINRKEDPVGGRRELTFQCN